MLPSIEWYGICRFPDCTDRQYCPTLTTTITHNCKFFSLEVDTRRPKSAGLWHHNICQKGPFDLHVSATEYARNIGLEGGDSRGGWSTTTRSTGRRLTIVAIHGYRLCWKPLPFSCYYLLLVESLGSPSCADVLLKHCSQPRKLIESPKSSLKVLVVAPISFNCESIRQLAS